MQPQQNGRDVATVGPPSPADVIERVLIHGDLKDLNAEQRTEYYRRICAALGVNHLTKPFAFLTLNGKLVLYALRDCTDQLRRIHGVSVVESTQEEIGDVYIVVCKVQNAEGRTDIARGAVHIGGLQKEALANALMKAETKAKRRATLSICGLGLLDETEVEDIEPQAKRNSSAEGKRDGSVKRFNTIRAEIAAAQECEMLQEIKDRYAQDLANFPLRWAIQLSQEFEIKWTDLGGDVSECPYPAMDDQG
jgi:hypothetical protein